MRKDVCVSMFFLFARYIGSYLWQHQQKFVRIFAHVSITNRSILHIKKRHDNVSMKFYARLPRCWSMDWSGGKKWYLCFSFQSKKKEIQKKTTIQHKRTRWWENEGEEKSDTTIFKLVSLPIASFASTGGFPKHRKNAWLSLFLYPRDKVNKLPIFFFWGINDIEMRVRRIHEKS